MREIFSEVTANFFGTLWNDSGAQESSRQPVIPPAPLTGYRGRDRGDAGRALLFCSSLQRDAASGRHHRSDLAYAMEHSIRIGAYSAVNVAQPRRH